MFFFYLYFSFYLSFRRSSSFDFNVLDFWTDAGAGVDNVDNLLFNLHYIFNWI